MAGQQIIKNRINAVQSIKKITHAMELVSASKLKKSRTEYNNVKNYYDSVKRSFDAILHHMNKREIEELFPQKNTGKKLYVIFTGDIGLAGSYNSAVIKLAKSTIKKDDKVIIIGFKGILGLEKIFQNQIIYKQKSEANADHYKLIQEITKKIYLIYKNEKFDSINVIYNKYVNNLVQVETNEHIYPFVFNNDSKLPKDSKYLFKQIEFEPSPQKVLNVAIPQYLNAHIYFAYSSSKLSELASRRSAMETATENANELIEELEIKYNRKRQANITQELNEIVSGANAV
ncbi:ATP synthase F1 subunit gamma [Mycoplasmopsis columbina]|uniref:ATP synthase gamma chain n=1 Tax=Mycoplasmopsis columbina SF7 TaxID=1037410 RepID=F9UJQ6_9BACT|nr:ATP synthase F1 subunit gamma [Mycoplasmopsis columbina]EGV00437.1 F0F1 ATP synthase subunit gamma [Mycoplasmopsis columbina SF7]VEU76698.1 ATP synthase gamma chain [Mycoplasmopsis columbina]